MQQISKPSLADLLAARKAEQQKQVEQSPEQAKMAGKEAAQKQAPSPKKPLTLAELIEQKKAEAEGRTIPMDKLAPAPAPAQSFQADPAAQVEIPAAEAEYSGAFALNIELNERQLMAKEYALAGKSFCLIGAAGTGKTTTQRDVAETLLKDGRLFTTEFKLTGVDVRVQAPSIAFCAFTRRAAANLERAIHKKPELAEALKYNVMTIHALLEYAPETYIDEETQEERFRFVPRRTAANPLNITHLVIEEASMVGLDLWEKLYDALPTGVQIIFIGDINQLPPVFGASIMNYALIQLPVVELTHVYRQKDGSGILDNAHRILRGKPVVQTPDFLLVQGKNQVSVGASKTAIAYSNLFKTWEEQGFYDPEQDIVLSPFNVKDLGTIAMNNWIAQHLGEKRNADVYEVIAGFNKLYLAVGDKVVYNKRDAVITKITKNWDYHGQEPQLHGPDLSRFGMRLLHKSADADSILAELEEETANWNNPINYQTFSLEELEKQDSERKQQASHRITIQYGDGGITEELCNAGDFAPAVFSLGYVLTVHKAQGCEWRKVFIIMHKDHSNMLYRELLYTAVTRAREQVICMTKEYLLTKAINSPRIKGNSLEDKIEFFNRELQLTGEVSCTK
jgi:hypothetical protein